MQELPRFNISDAIIDAIMGQADPAAVVAQGQPVKEFLHCSDEQLALLYKQARHLLEEARYEDAVDAFALLCFLDGSKGDLWLGLGMALQLLKRYESAIDAYELAAACDVDSPVPYFYLGKCLFAIHDHRTAHDALEMAVTYAGERAGYEELLRQAQQALKALDKMDEMEG